MLQINILLDVLCFSLNLSDQQYNKNIPFSSKIFIIDYSFGSKYDDLLALLIFKFTYIEFNDFVFMWFIHSLIYMEIISNLFKINLYFSIFVNTLLDLNLSTYILKVWHRAPMQGLSRSYRWPNITFVADLLLALLLFTLIKTGFPDGRPCESRPSYKFPIANP